MIKQFRLFIFAVFFIPTLSQALVVDINYTGSIEAYGEAEDGNSISGWFRLNIDEAAGSPLAGGYEQLIYTGETNNNHSLITGLQPSSHITSNSTSRDRIGVANLSSTNSSGESLFNDWLTVSDSSTLVEDFTDGSSIHSYYSYSWFIMVLNQEFIDSSYLKQLDLTVNDSDRLGPSMGQMSISHIHYDVNGIETSRTEESQYYNLSSLQIISSIPEPSQLSLLLAGTLIVAFRKKQPSVI